MRILTEQELRRAVDGTVRRTLAENSLNEGLGGWLLAGAAGLLGLRYWPQIKKLFSGQDDNGSQTPPQGSMPPGMPPSDSGSGNTVSGGTDITLPPLSGSPSDGQLEDWQKEWRRTKGQDLGQNPSDKPNFNDAPPQARVDNQGQSQTRPSREISELDKVDALLSNPMVLRQLTRDETRLLLMYRMMLSNNSGRSSNNTYNRYLPGHKASSTRPSNTHRGNRIPTSGNGRYLPGHRMN